MAGNSSVTILGEMISLGELGEIFQRIMSGETSLCEEAARNLAKKIEEQPPEFLDDLLGT